MGFPVRHYAMYTKNRPITKRKPVQGVRGLAKKNPTYFPKYANYINRPSNLSPFPPSENIKTYSKQIYMFAIQDTFSRYIIHACLKEQPSPDFRYSHSWYNVNDCFDEAIDHYGKPFEFMID